MVNGHDTFGVVKIHFTSYYLDVDCIEKLQIDWYLPLRTEISYVFFSLKGTKNLTNTFLPLVHLAFSDQKGFLVGFSYKLASAA